MPKEKPKSPQFEATNYVPALLSTLNNRLSSSASDLYLRHFGIGINEWRILTVMARSPDCSAAHIAEEASIHITVISRCLRGMEKKGLVKIQRESWQRKLALTEEGSRMFGRVAAVALHREALLLTGISDQDLALLKDLLLRLTSNLALVNAYDPNTEMTPA